MAKRLYKSSDKKISGVCGGIAEYFSIDPSIVRILWAVLTFVTSGFPGIILYIVMAFVLPDRPSSEFDWSESTARENPNSESDQKFNSYFAKEKEEVHRQKEEEARQAGEENRN